MSRAAAAHRGLTYTRRLSLNLDRRFRYRRGETLNWSETLAYAVGLIATDGCLISDHRHIGFVTADQQLMETFCDSIGRERRYRVCREDSGIVYRIQFSDVRLYRWLESVGLMPRKSLVLGGIAVPDALVAPLVRGLLDGDGTVQWRYVVPNPRQYPNLTYPQLTTRFISASRTHIDWLEKLLRRTFEVTGSVRKVVRVRNGVQGVIYQLKYAKYASIALLSVLYSDPNAPHLERKRAVWLDYQQRARKTRIWTSRSGGTVLRA